MSEDIYISNPAMLLVFFTKLDRKSSSGSKNILKNREKVFTFPCEKHFREVHCSQVQHCSVKHAHISANRTLAIKHFSEVSKIFRKINGMPHQMTSTTNFLNRWVSLVD